MIERCVSSGKESSKRTLLVMNCHSPNPHPSMPPRLGWLPGQQVYLAWKANFSQGNLQHLPSLLESPRNCHNINTGFSGPLNQSIIPATCTTPAEVDNTADHVPTFQPPMQHRASTSITYAIIASTFHIPARSSEFLLKHHRSGYAEVTKCPGAPAPRVKKSLISGCSDVVDRSRPPNSPHAGLCQLRAGLTLGPVRNSSSSPGPGSTNPAWD
ncbi:hypothetical protein B0T18DRAFT_179495 [Schizothecium vesticola]|uniref:Uncharacterized protein n=1 Tax=Schizothecium vesticola TaxID=314040 RepID=A0AA40EPQ5_9PEZI|nr:hypothetical protein B0T18DRAFT_179495 [Schizothecium vesticola]